MKNVKELRSTEAKVIDRLMDGTLDYKNAKVVVAACNSMISSARSQIEHYRAIGKKSKIDFLITS